MKQVDVAFLDFKVKQVLFIDDDFDICVLNSYRTSSKHYTFFGDKNNCITKLNWNGVYPDRKQPRKDNKPVIYNLTSISLDYEKHYFKIKKNFISTILKLFKIIEEV